MTSIDKEILRGEIVGRLEREFATLSGAALASREEATDADNRQEGKFDMRGQLAAYMAAGQAKLAEELGAAIAAYRALSLDSGTAEGAATGSLVAVDGPGGRSWYFLGPARGGMELGFGGALITVVTVSSPIGRALFGRRLGEAVLLSGRGAPLGIVASLT